MDFGWHRAGADKSRALEGNGLTELSSIADFASVLHKKNDATAVFQERHNPIGQLATVLHIGFAEFEQA